MHEKIKAKVFESVLDPFEDAIQSSYSNSNEGPKLELLNIVEQALTEVVIAGQGSASDQSESIVKQIVKYVL